MAFSRNDVEIVIGKDFTVVRISAIRILISLCKVSTIVAATSIDVGAVVIFNHVVERRRCCRIAGIRSTDVGTARNIVEVDASQRRNTCRVDHNLIRFKKTCIILGCIGISFVSLDDIALSSSGVPFIFFIFNAIAITDPVRFTGNRFFVIAMSIKIPCIIVLNFMAPTCVVIVVICIHKNSHILACYCRTRIGRIRRSHSAS